jgi:hypothetical protein
VAPFTFPVAVAGGLGRFDLSLWHMIIEEIDTPRRVKNKTLVIVTFFILFIV